MHVDACADTDHNPMYPPNLKQTKYFFGSKGISVWSLFSAPLVSLVGEK